MADYVLIGLISTWIGMIVGWSLTWKKMKGDEKTAGDFAKANKAAIDQLQQLNKSYEEELKIIREGLNQNERIAAQSIAVEREKLQQQKMEWGSNLFLKAIGADRDDR